MTENREKRKNKHFGWKIHRDKKAPFRWRAYHRKTGTKIDCEKFEVYSLSFYAEMDRINKSLMEIEAKPGSLGMLIKLYRAGIHFQSLAPRTQFDYQKCFDYLQQIDDTPLDRFNPPLVAKIRDRALAKHKFRFANKVRMALYVIFDWGIEYGYVKSNPVIGVKTVKRPKGMPDANRPWTDAEREAVLSALPAHMILPMTLMMFYGLDPQDALGLPKTAVANGGIDTRRGKTSQPVYLQLLEPVAEALANAKPHNAITLCANSRGKPWTYNGFSTNWHRERGKLEKAGTVQLGLTLKGLRHTVATILREMGCDYGAIQLILGHATEAMARHYSKRADMTSKTTAVVADFGVEMNKRKTKVVKPGA